MPGTAKGRGGGGGEIEQGGDLGIGGELRAEPASWAMMLLGFAGIGMAARRRGVGRALSSV
jgi:hypothetical protein